MGLRIARGVVSLLAIGQLALYLVLALRTLAYPFPLEWMEGGTVDVLGRVIAHQPLYAKPTADYVPYIYPPFYYWVSAQAARIVGVGFLAPRLVSLIAICAVFGLIAGLVRINGGSWLAAIAGAGLFAGTYESTERWFHLARVDSLFLALLLGAVYLLQAGKKTSSAVGAGILLVLASLTKQTTLFVAAPFLLITAIRAPRRPIVTAATFAALLGAIIVVMHHQTDGWSTYFLYQLPLLHGPAAHGSRWFWRYDMAPVMPFALVVVALLFIRAIVQREFRWRWIVALCVGGIGASWAARLHSGGAANSLMPAYAALAVAMPLSIDLDTRPIWRLAACLMVGLQIALVLHNWTGTIPTAADQEAGIRYLDFLRHVDGDVIVWHQRFVQTRAGKRSWGLEMAAEDVLRANDPNTRSALETTIIEACRTGRVAGVVDPPDWLQRAVSFGAPVVLFDNPAVFRPVAGDPKRPERYFPILPLHHPDEPGRHDEVKSQPEGRLSTSDQRVQGS